MRPRLLKHLRYWTFATAILLCTGALGADFADPREQTRCGWFHNPSPNNASLIDRDGEWPIAVQGQFEAEGDWPEFGKSRWVRNGNANYGYGCVCMRVMTDLNEHRITSILASTVKPLATCRRDKRLKALPRDSE
jgi:hypothetical protein